MNDDQRELNEQRNRARNRREQVEPARVASLGAIAVEWVAIATELPQGKEEERKLNRELGNLKERQERLGKQGAALESAYRSLVGQTETQLSSQSMASEMRGMAEWTHETLAKKGGK